ncbi:MAG: nickel-dependent lactate racemase [Sedimentisphaerales bacterium]|nr:nickel-dependent lactate racemase [Sedimentisphaerales bacterium]
MRIKLSYGKEGLDIHLSDNLNVTAVESKHVRALENQAETVRDALRHPIAAKPLKDSVKSSDKVAIVFNDITRPTPYKIILPVLLDEIEHVPDNHIILLNATGTHRPNTEAELREILGDAILRRFRIIQNDALDSGSHTFAGTTENGNEIRLHRQYVESDMRILTGFIEPHFFTGFSGGGKACMPGLALLETILRNHSVKNLDNAKATWGITDGNPVWEEITEAASIVQPTFLLNVTLNRDKQITGVFAGDLKESHRRGCIFAMRNAMIPVKEPCDIVISCNSGYPLDLNLYQSIKGISAAAQIVKQDGSIIMAADCWDGIPEHGEYAGLLLEAESPERLLQRIRAPGFSAQDMWQAQIQALILQKANVYFYSNNLSDEQITGAMLRPCHSIEATVDKLIQEYGQDVTICILLEGPQSIPYIDNARR